MKFENWIQKEDRFYLILEYCNSKDLGTFFRKMKKEHKITEEMHILSYFKQVVNGFSGLRANNIIHRDLKPTNIMVHNNILKISDLGLSKRTKEKDEAIHD